VYQLHVIRWCTISNFHCKGLTIIFQADVFASLCFYIWFNLFHSLRATGIFLNTVLHVFLGHAICRPRRTSLDWVSSCSGVCSWCCLSLYVLVVSCRCIVSLSCCVVSLSFMPATWRVDVACCVRVVNFWLVCSWWQFVCVYISCWGDDDDGGDDTKEAVFTMLLSLQSRCENALGLFDKCSQLSTIRPSQPTWAVSLPAAAIVCTHHCRLFLVGGLG